MSTDGKAVNRYYTVDAIDRQKAEAGTEAAPAFLRRVLRGYAL